MYSLCPYYYGPNDLHEDIRPGYGNDNLSANEKQPAESQELRRCPEYKPPDVGRFLAI